MWILSKINNNTKLISFKKKLWNFTFEGSKEKKIIFRFMLNLRCHCNMLGQNAYIGLIDSNRNKTVGVPSKIAKDRYK